MEKSHKNSRRKFIQQTAIAGAGLMLVKPLDIIAQKNSLKSMSEHIKSKG